ncbi:MAG: ribosome maturation factor RimM [Pseudomonadota bacterium]
MSIRSGMGKRAESDASETLICLGAIAGAHGVNGAFKVKTFTQDPAGIADYGPLFSEDRKLTLTLTVIRTLSPSLILANAPEIADREAAISHRGIKLFAPRSALPALKDEDEYYLDDLVGLPVLTPEGAPAGRVAAVFNFGAGDLLELRNVPGVKGAIMAPFTKAVIPGVDLVEGRLTIDADALGDLKG